MFLEARTIELLLLQLEQINTPDDQISLSKSDCEKMLYGILSSSILRKLIRFIDLAADLGQMNTLKKGFKEVFNTTVFNYWSSLKMQNAKN